MIRSFDALAIRQMRTRRLRAGLTTMAVALGVGMVFGVLLLSATVRGTFDDLIASAWGTTDLVVSPANNAGTLPTDTLSVVRVTHGVANAGAMVGASLRRLDRTGRPIKGAKGEMRVAGFDPKGAPPYDFRYVEGRPMRSGNEVVVERNWARDRGVRLGDAVSALAPSGRARLRVVGVFSFSSGLSFGGQGLAGMPLATARRLFDQPEGFHTISVRLQDRDQVELVRRRLKARARGRGPGGDAVRGRRRRQGAAQGARRRAHALLGHGAVRRRLPDPQQLHDDRAAAHARARDAADARRGRRDVARSVLTEAAVLAVAGTVAGLALGLGMAQLLIALLRGLDVPVGHLQVSAGSAAAAAAAGIVATLARRRPPGAARRRVSPCRPRRAGATGRERPGLARLAVALALFLPGLLLGGRYWFGDQGGGGFLGPSAASRARWRCSPGWSSPRPFVIPPLVRGLAVPLRRLLPTTGRLAADAATANPRRTAATAIALSVGLSVVVVNATMARSFVTTIEQQITAGYERDLTIRPLGAGLEKGGAQVVPKAVAREVAAVPQAGVVTPLRLAIVDLPGLRGQRTGLVEGIDPAAWGEVDRSPVSGATRAQALRGVAGGGVIVAQAYATRAGLHPGDTIVLRGPRGAQRTRVAAIMRTVTDFNGLVVQVSQRTMAGVYGITADAQLVVRARSAADRRPLAAAVDRLLARRYPGVESLSNADVKSDVGAQVKKQFDLFNSIVAIAVLVSLLGVVNTLAMSVLERTREVGVLRALGASRWHVRATMVAESLLVTIAGAVAGLVPGVLIAWVWSRGLGDMLPGLVFSLPVGTIVAIAVAAVVLGALAAVLPARRAARMDVVRALGAD